MRILITEGVGFIITNTILYSLKNKKNKTILIENKEDATLYSSTSKVYGDLKHLYRTHQFGIEDESLEKLITWQKTLIFINY